MAQTGSILDDIVFSISNVDVRSIVEPEPEHVAPPPVVSGNEWESITDTWETINTNWEDLI